MTQIRILIVDDHPLVRKGIRSLLNNHHDLVIVGEAENGTIALQQVQHLHPDIILLDIKMPGLDGIDVIRQLRRDHQEVRIIVLTTYDDEGYISGALEAGAHGYLLKNISHEMLADSIRAVHAGERLLSQDLMGQVLRQFANMASDQKRRGTGFTRDELNLIRMIADGKSNKTIADIMFWSETTVKRRVQEIYDKLGVDNRVQAAAEAGIIVGLALVGHQMTQ
jgi:DNA-binding NarL/FixJ family response regulator